MLGRARWRGRARLLISLGFVLTSLAHPPVSIGAAATACAPDAGPFSVAFGLAPPSFAIAGADLASFTVQIRCADDETTDASWSGTITVTLDGGAFATVGPGTTTKSTTSGSAIFGGSGLRINAAGSYTITATANPAPGFGALVISSATSDDLVIDPASPHHLAFMTQPDLSIDAGGTLSEIVVNVRDAFNNTVTRDSGTRITLIPKTSPGGNATAFGGGTVTRLASLGEATFDDLVVSTAGTFRITATNNFGLTPDPISDPFTVIAGTSATKLAFLNTSLKLSDKGMSDILTVQQQDDGVNPIPVALADGALRIWLSSDSLGGSFWRTDGVTKIPGGCVAIPVGKTYVQFRYKDTIPGHPTIIASTLDLGDCRGEPGSLDDATLSADGVNVQMAPRTVTISGAGFGTTGKVTWGSTEIANRCATATATNCIKRFSDRAVVVVPPPGDAGASVAPVTVSGANVLATADTTFHYGSVVTRLKPQAGPIAGGTPVTISGAGFGPFIQDFSAVNWGGSPVTVRCSLTLTRGCIARWSASSVIVRAPAASAGASPVSVRVNGGAAATSIDGHFYYGSLVGGLKPQAGPAIGGTSVTIAGLGFGSTAGSVDWGGTIITRRCVEGTTTRTDSCISKWGDRLVVVRTPPGTASVPVRIVPAGSTVPSGALTTSDTRFYYGSVVVGLKPQQGPGRGGTRVTISGAVFGPARGVITWHGNPIAAPCPIDGSIPVSGCIGKWTATSIVVVAPAQGTAPARVAVSVTPSGGPVATMSSAIDPYFYYGPLVTALKP